jgi:serine/threonine protein phosphatase PrpC
MSRSLGDVLAKKAGVIAEPELSTFTYDAESPEQQGVVPKWIVLASDGVWDVMSNEQVAQFLYDPRNAGKSAQKLSEQLLRFSRARWLQAPAN